MSEMSGEERWAVFFRYAQEREQRKLVNELLRAEEGIAMAGKALLTVSRDEIERARLSSEYEGMLDRQAELTDARREARREGRAEAAQEARREKLETARKMKEDGLPPELIQKYTNLPPEEIAKIHG
jgi:predicted transposase/invertase (TIGR01784 family)